MRNLGGSAYRESSCRALEAGYPQRGAHIAQDGVQGLLRVTPSELAKHRTRDDAWSAYNGRVYNITPYLRYHPGGIGELMRSAGRDGTELFSPSASRTPR